jgi:hypothetical protein
MMEAVKVTNPELTKNAELKNKLENYEHYKIKELYS